MGDLEQARKYYQQAVDRFGSELASADGDWHPLVAEARKKLELLDSNAGAAFYLAGAGHAGWPKRVPKTSRGVGRPELPPLTLPPEGTTTVPVPPPPEPPTGP
jgi:hypothetical protein